MTKPLQPGQLYLVKTATAVTPGRVTRVQYAVDVNTLEQKQVPTLGLNEIGLVRLELDRPVAFDPYRENRETGSFILIDRFSNATVAAGMVIAAAPLESQKAPLAELDAGLSDAAGFQSRRISLTEFSISGTEVGVVDLTREWGSIEFEVSTSFLDYLGKGNRILFRLRDVGQLEPVARMAYEHNLNFEFGRDQDRVNVMLYQDRQSSVKVHEELHGGGSVKLFPIGPLQPSYTPEPHSFRMDFFIPPPEKTCCYFKAVTLASSNLSCHTRSQGGSSRMKRVLSTYFPRSSEFLAGPCSDPGIGTGYARRIGRLGSCGSKGALGEAACRKDTKGLHSSGNPVRFIHRATICRAIGCRIRHCLEWACSPRSDAAIGIVRP